MGHSYVWNSCDGESSEAIPNNEYNLSSPQTLVTKITHNFVDCGQYKIGYKSQKAPLCLSDAVVAYCGPACNLIRELACRH